MSTTAAAMKDTAESLAQGMGLMGVKEPQEMKEATQELGAEEESEQVNVIGENVYTEHTGPAHPQRLATGEDAERAAKFRFESRNLCVVVDDSESSAAAFTRALHHRRTADIIFLVHCAESEEAKKEGETLLNSYTEKLKDRRLKRWNTALLCDSNPEEAIHKYVTENNVNCIFIGRQQYAPVTKEGEKATLGGGLLGTLFEKHEGLDIMLCN